MRHIAILLLVLLMLNSCSSKHHYFETEEFQLNMDREGRVTAMIDRSNDRDYFPPGQEAPLLSLRINNVYVFPSHAEVDESDNSILLAFSESRSEARIRFEEKGTHLTFELVSLESPEDVDLVLWGPFPTTIKEIIGETVGVVRNDEFAMGIQSLNLKTLGGYPTNEDDSEPSYNIFASSNYIDVSDSIKVLYRGQTARSKEYGSVVQAYCRNRNKDRIIPVWNHDKYFVPAFDDGGVVGTKIALFGTPVEKALTRLGEIELEENLPHPMIDGTWGKVATEATAAYLIIDFGVDNLEEALELVRKAGLRYLYHGNPFENWGHFDLREDHFPKNWESLRECVDRAAEEDIKIGVHTLSNFITTNDPYVTPIPDPRLAKVGTSKLVHDIDANTTEIEIEDPDFFNQMRNNSLHAAVIGNEIIRYNRVAENGPWILTDCERGAFGTEPMAHTSGSEIGKLMDHAYKVFLTDNSLSEEVARKIADLYNKTGIQQISFDGLEGNWSTGMGQYGRQRFVKTWYDNLKPELQGEVITDASNPGHFFWHIFTRMNWGEPWYAGFRESQTQLRLLNQEFFYRNLMPAMLGWFRMSPETSIEDIEWLLARAAGFDAGFCLVTSPSIVTKNGFGEEILNKIKQWEILRLGNAFSDDQKKGMRDISKEFQLIEKSNNTWEWIPVYASLKNEHKKVDRQPGEPTFTKFILHNPFDEQPLQFTLKVLSESASSKIRNITMELDQFKTISLETTLGAGEILQYKDNGEAVIYDDSWNVLRRIPLDTLSIPSGEHEIRFDCTFVGNDDSSVTIEFRVLGRSEMLRLEE